MSRAQEFRILSWLLSLSLLPISGCMSPWFSKTSDSKTSVGTRREAIKEKLQSEERPTIVSEIGSPAMLTQSRLQNIGLVTQLHKTGGTVNASQQREKMLDTMRRQEADQPNAVLDDVSTTMVVATVAVPPAAAKGDLLDVAVHLSMHANATDLERGWLMKTPLMEMSRLGGQVREGFERTYAEGSIVSRYQMTGSEDPKAKLEGVIVGGGRLLKSRQLGISIQEDFADAITMSAVVPAINQRFTYFDGRKQTGIATPRDENYIEIAVPPRYRLDPYHFLNVVLQISFNETEPQKLSRVETLRRQLAEPTTVRNACWQLEALGEQSIPILVSALQNENPEIRFYVAHSLAYLNDPRAIPALKSLCMQEPAFRSMCLNGLAVLDNYEAADALRELLHAAEPEVKYGAVLALRKRDASDPEVLGTAFGQTGSVLEIPSSGPPLVAISLSQVPEITVFGEPPLVHIPTFQYVNPRIIVSPSPEGGLAVSRFTAGEDDQVVHTTADLPSVLAAISEVGGVYGDWVHFVRECHTNGYIAEPCAINPIPSSGRTYERRPQPQTEPGESLYENTFIDTSADSEAAAGEEETSSAWYNPFSWSR